MPDPRTIDLRRLRLAHLEPGRVLHRVAASAHGALTPNRSGRGDGRFSPLAGRAHLYGGDTRTVPLLETVFHGVHERRPRIVYEATDLIGRELARLVVVERLALIDLRDTALERLGVGREQLVTTTAAHYPCARRWADAVLRRRVGGVSPVGMLWNSRVAELAGGDSPLLDDLLEGRTSEAYVLYDLPEGVLVDAGGGFRSLVGPTQGRLLLDRIAEQLDATIL